MPAIDELLAGNRAFADGREPSALPAPPSRKVAIVTCMDCRIDPIAAFGLAEGEAHVMRNAGGAVTDDMIRSLAISQRALGTVDVMVVHHTKCGMQTLTEDGFRAQLLEATGQTPPFAIESFSDLDADVRQSVQRVKGSPFLLNEGEVRGFVYDVESGALREVV